jgi:hypothetical protein
VHIRQREDGDVALVLSRTRDALTSARQRSSRLDRAFSGDSPGGGASVTSAPKEVSLAVVRYVGFFPPTGFPDRAWIDDRACDLLVKSARRVVELYSEEISGLGLIGKASEVRVFMHPAPKGQEHVSVDVHLDFYGAFEGAIALIPASVEGLVADQRADLAFAILDGVMREFAPHRDWAVSALDLAESKSRARGLEFTWHGPWKSSPDQRHEARGVFWLEDDGFGRAVVEVRPRGDADAAILRSADRRAYCTAAGFARSAKTLRWSDGRVTMTSSIDILGRDDGEIRFDPASGTTGTLVARKATAETVSRQQPVVAVTSSRRVPDVHTIRFIGGGPDNGVPATYLRALAEHLEQLSETGHAWWSTADRNLLEIQYVITDHARGVKVRRLRNRVTAVIERSLNSFGTSDAAQLARNDVNALIHAVTKRMDLRNPPGV